MPWAFPNKVWISAKGISHLLWFMKCHPSALDFRTLVGCFTFIRSGAGPLSVGVVSLPQMMNIPLYHHQTPSHSHLPLGSPLQYFSIAAPPQYRESGVTSKCAEGLRLVRQIEPQTGAGAQIEEAMLGDPLPEHTARGPLAVVQHQVWAIHCDATLQRFTLQDEEAFFWDEDIKKDSTSPFYLHKEIQHFPFKCFFFYLLFLTRKVSGGHFV